MNYKPIVWMSVLILAMFSVFAAPPFTGSSAIGQIQIVALTLDAHKAGTPMEFLVHAFNSSGYTLTNTMATSSGCDVDMYTINGTHIVKDKMSFDGRDWYYVLNSTLINQMGLTAVPYLVTCNNTKEAGWFNSEFYLTEQAVNVPVDKYPNYNLALIFGILAIAFFLVYFSEKFKLEGATFTRAITALGINLIFKLTAFVLVIYDLFYIRNTLPSLQAITPMYDTMLNFFAYGIGVLFFLLYIIYQITCLVENFKVHKYNKSLERQY